MVYEQEISPLSRENHQRSELGKTPDAYSRREDLGQVFTSDIVAKLMVDLLVENLEGNNILDPCVGKNIFFEALQEKERVTGKSFIKVGIEIDPKIVPREWFSQKLDRQLLLQNFFDFNPSTRFDGIVMNPPYVRQENLATATINSKEKIIKVLKAEYSPYIEKKQNLYVFFFMKAHKLLKDFGKLVAICYDSWLYTRFGITFKKFLDENFRVEKIIHFEERAFVNADVGATVLQMQKLPCRYGEANQHAFRYVKFKEPRDYDEGNVLAEVQTRSCSDLLLIDDNSFNFPKDVFLRLADLAKDDIRRGSSPEINRYLLLDAPKFKETVPIIKEVKKIHGFKVLPTHLKYVINTNGKEVSTELRSYLDEVKVKIAETGRYHTARRKIENGERWYKIRLVKPGSIIFNYYLRKNIKFIFNPSCYHASDNFYVFDTIIEPTLAIALLNSILTKIGVLRKSRTQGMGLRKIQLYEFREVPVIDPTLFDEDDISKLTDLGSKLIDAIGSDYVETLHEIDQTLLNVYNELMGTNLSLDYVYKFFRKNMREHK